MRRTQRTRRIAALRKHKLAVLVRHLRRAKSNRSCLWAIIRAHWNKIPGGRTLYGAAGAALGAAHAAQHGYANHDWRAARDWVLVAIGESADRESEEL